MEHIRTEEEPKKVIQYGGREITIYPSKVTFSGMRYDTVEEAMKMIDKLAMMTIIDTRDKNIL